MDCGDVVNVHPNCIVLKLDSDRSLCCDEFTSLLRVCKF